MLEDQFYIYKKEVDWSVLREGFSIPVSTQVVFQERIKNYIKRGEKRDINIILDNHTYHVKLANQIFDEKKISWAFRYNADQIFSSKSICNQTP